MRQLDRYVLRHFLKIFAVCVLGVPFLLTVITMADKLDIFLDQGVTWVQVSLHYLYQFPLQSLIGFPIAALLASVFTVSTLDRRSEITAMKAAGISFYRFSLPLLAASTLLSFVALGLTEVVAVTNQKSEEVLEIEQSRSDAVRRSFVYRAEEGLVYKVRVLDTLSNEMSDVQVDREGTGPEFPTMNVTADLARYDSLSQHWRLQEGWVRRFQGPVDGRAYRFREMFIRGLDEPPKELLAKSEDEDKDEPDNMRYAELGEFIRSIERSGGTPTALRTARAFRIAYPFACLIIAIFGMPLANTTKRGGAPTSIGIALGTTILFLLFIGITEELGAGGAISPHLAAWLPNAVLLLAGCVLFAKLRT